VDDPDAAAQDGPCVLRDLKGHRVQTMLGIDLGAHRLRPGPVPPLHGFVQALRIADATRDAIPEAQGIPQEVLAEVAALPSAQVREPLDAGCAISETRCAQWDDHHGGQVFLKEEGPFFGREPAVRLETYRADPSWIASQDGAAYARTRLNPLPQSAL